MSKGGKAHKRSPAGREMLYGFHPVMEALTAGRRSIDHLMLDRRLPSARQGRIVAQAEDRHVPVTIHAPAELTQACGSDQHQGVVMAAAPLPLTELTALVAERSGGAAGGDLLIVLLDGIVDPHNLGAIVRSAHCAGADALVIPRDRAVGATPAVSKASAGALEHVQLCRVTNLAVTIGWLKAQGVWVSGLTMAGAQTVFQADFKGPSALVIGGEEKGLRPLVQKQCDYLVSIPMRGRIDSLNASAAAAVVLYEAYRQRHAGCAVATRPHDGAMAVDPDNHP